MPTSERGPQQNKSRMRDLKNDIYNVRVSKELKRHHGIVLLFIISLIVVLIAKCMAGAALDAELRVSSMLSAEPVRTRYFAHEPSCIVTQGEEASGCLCC